METRLQGMNAPISLVSERPKKLTLEVQRPKQYR
jgi:hypothetical protein